MGHFLSKLLNTVFKLYKGITGDGSNDYIRNNTTLANYTWPNNWTMEIWFRPSSSIAANQGLFSSNNAVSNNNLFLLGFAVINGFTDLFATFYGSTGTLIMSNVYFGFNFFASDSNRRNYMATIRFKDNGNGTFTTNTFANGKKFGTSFTSANKPTAFPSFNFLTDRAVAGRYAGFQILNVRFYTDAKTDTEITNAYNHGQGNNVLSNILFELPCDTITGGTSTPDISGNGHNFELVNFTSPVTSDFVPNSGRFNIVFDGNSMTFGTGATGSGSYPTQTLLNLNSNYSFYNIGVTGQTIDQMSADFETDPFYLYDTSMSKNIYVAWEGTNAMRSPANQTPAQAYASMVTLCNKAKKRGFVVVVLTTLPSTTAGFNTNQVAFNNLLKADFTTSIGTRIYSPNVGVTYADRLVDVAAITNLSDPSNTTYYGDGIHPTNAGYALVGVDAAAGILTL